MADAKTHANVGRVSPQGVTRQDGDGVSPQGVGLRCANPTYISIARTLKKHHGSIHTHGKSKVATLLLYLNPAWAASRG